MGTSVDKIIENYYFFIFRDTNDKMEEFEMHKIKSKISDFRLQIQEEEFQRNKKRNDEGKFLNSCCYRYDI